MSDLILSKVPTFGFESKHICFKPQVPVIVTEDEHKKRIMVSNAFKIAGYFPVIGTAVGVTRLILAGKAMQSHDTNINPSYWVVRGIIETLGLGILLLPVDGLITGKRKVQWLLLKPQTT